MHFENEICNSIIYKRDFQIVLARPQLFHSTKVYPLLKHVESVYQQVDFFHASVLNSSNEGMHAPWNYIDIFDLARCVRLTRLC